METLCCTNMLITNYLNILTDVMYTHVVSPTFSWKIATNSWRHKMTSPWRLFIWPTVTYYMDIWYIQYWRLRCTYVKYSICIYTDFAAVYVCTYDINISCAIITVFIVGLNPSTVFYNQRKSQEFQVIYTVGSCISTLGSQFSSSYVANSES